MWGMFYDIFLRNFRIDWYLFVTIINYTRVREFFKTWMIWREKLTFSQKKWSSK